jgi:hypothetical protein
MPQYLTTDELSSRIKYDARYIRERLTKQVFREGVHYVRPFGGRKILFIWEEIETLLQQSGGRPAVLPIPLRRKGGR